MAFVAAGEGYRREVLSSAPAFPAPPPGADLDADGVPEVVHLEGGQVRIEQGGKVVWRSEPGWRVVDLAAGDIWNDLRQEVVLAMWKDDTAGVARSHPFIVGHRHGRYDLLWGGSAAAAPIRDLDLGDVDGDGQNELVVLEGEYGQREEGAARHVTVWRWNGWGFTLLWRSEAGRYRELHLVDLDGGEGLDIVVEGR